MSFRSCDEVSGDVQRVPHVVDVTDNSEGLSVLGAVGTIRARIRGRLCRQP